jgi:hypothetical protein
MCEKSAKAGRCKMKQLKLRPMVYAFRLFDLSVQIQYCFVYKIGFTIRQSIHNFSTMCYLFSPVHISYVIF